MEYYEYDINKRNRLVRLRLECKSLILNVSNILGKLPGVYLNFNKCHIKLKQGAMMGKDQFGKDTASNLEKKVNDDLRKLLNELITELEASIVSIDYEISMIDLCEPSSDAEVTTTSSGGGGSNFCMKAMD